MEAELFSVSEVRGSHCVPVSLCSIVGGMTPQEMRAHILEYNPVGCRTGTRGGGMVRQAYIPALRDLGFIVDEVWNSAAHGSMTLGRWLRKWRDREPDSVYLTRIKGHLLAMTRNEVVDTAVGAFKPISVSARLSDKFCLRCRVHNIWEVKHYAP